MPISCKGKSARVSLNVLRRALNEVLMEELNNLLRKALTIVTGAIEGKPSTPFLGNETPEPDPRMEALIKARMAALIEAASSLVAFEITKKEAVSIDEAMKCAKSSLEALKKVAIAAEALKLYKNAKTVIVPACVLLKTR